MAQSNNQPVRQDKTIEIIRAAQYRFGLYGIEKTTMNEIASDLNMSKGSLYYYFPDKEHLYKAVIEREQSEFITALNEKISKTEDPVILLQEYVNTRLELFRSLINLSRLRMESYGKIGPLISEAMGKFRKIEKELIMKILIDGNEKRVLDVADVDATASLFLDLLKGLRVVMINKLKLMYLEPHEYEIIEKKTKDFTKIFINGILLK